MWRVHLKSVFPSRFTLRAFHFHFPFPPVSVNSLPRPNQSCSPTIPLLIFNPVSVICRNKNARNVTETVKIHFEISRTSSPLPLATPLNCLQLPPSLRLPRSPFRIPLLSYLCPPVHPLLPFPFPLLLTIPSLLYTTIPIPSNPSNKPYFLILSLPSLSHVDLPTSQFTAYFSPSSNPSSVWSPKWGRTLTSKILDYLSFNGNHTENIWTLWTFVTSGHFSPITETFSSLLSRPTIPSSSSRFLCDPERFLPTPHCHLGYWLDQLTPRTKVRRLVCW